METEDDMGKRSGFSTDVAPGQAGPGQPRSGPEAPRVLSPGGLKQRALGGEERFTGQGDEATRGTRATPRSLDWSVQGGCPANHPAARGQYRSPAQDGREAQNRLPNGGAGPLSSGISFEGFTDGKG